MDHPAKGETSGSNRGRGLFYPAIVTRTDHESVFFWTSEFGLKENCVHRERVDVAVRRGDWVYLASEGAGFRVIRRVDPILPTVVGKEGILEIFTYGTIASVDRALTRDFGTVLLDSQLYPMEYGCDYTVRLQLISPLSPLRALSNCIWRISEVLEKQERSSCLLLVDKANPLTQRDSHHIAAAASREPAQRGNPAQNKNIFLSNGLLKVDDLKRQEAERQSELNASHYLKGATEAEDVEFCVRGLLKKKAIRQELRKVDPALLSELKSMVKNLDAKARE